MTALIEPMAALALFMGATRLGVILTTTWYVFRACRPGHCDWAKGRGRRAFLRS